jgi:transposase-like protein
MALVYVHCPECQSIDVVQYGKQANGTQRYRCNNRDCPRTIFLLQYSDKGRLPAVKAHRLLRLIGFHGHDLPMVSRRTVYSQGENRNNRRLRFPKSGHMGVEEA